MKKLTSLLCAVGSMGVAGVSYAQAADQTAALEQMQQQIAQMQAQFNEYANASEQEAVVAAGDDRADDIGGELVAEDSSSLIESPLFPSVTIAPYIGVRSHFDGAELIINNPSINDDVKLLELRQAERAELAAQGITTSQPRLIFSGDVEGEVYSASNYDGSDSSNIDLSDAELNAFIEANDWVSGYITITYSDAADGQANPINNSGYELSQGFMTVGNLDSSAFYSTIGQMYVPFGSYSSFMVTSPLTKDIGRTKARALLVGYNPQREGFEPFASAYAFQGSTNVANSDSSGQIKNYGLNGGVQFAKDQYSFSLGASYINNIAESEGMQGNGDSSQHFNGFAEQASYEDIGTRVPGADVYGTFGYGDWTAIAEWTGATSQFDEDNLSFNGDGAQPKAAAFEVGYAFNAWRPSSVALGYNQSWEALALNLPEKAYVGTYSVSVWERTLFSLQYIRNSGYDNGTTGRGQGEKANYDQLGEQYSEVMLRADVFF
jgi:hypothetical protein